MPQIEKPTIIFDNILTLQEAQIIEGEHSYSRIRVKRQDGAAVLVYNKQSDLIILTKQFRFPIYDKVSADILEILAGKVDEGEEPTQAAIREAQEEIGYKIRKEKLEKIATCFVSPGYTSECLHLFYAEVNNEDQTDEGGGLDSEHEQIEVIEMKSGEFINLVRNMVLADAKTLLAGHWFINKISNG